MRELDYGKVGKRIRQLRKAKGWSQDVFAKKCGISMSFLGHIEQLCRGCGTSRKKKITTVMLYI